MEDEIIIKEFILCSAINYNGIIIAGRRHRDCYATLRGLLPELKEADEPDRSKQGFLTSKNRYVNRKEGWNIAYDQNQIAFGFEVSNRGEDSELISENLYLDL